MKRLLIEIGAGVVAIVLIIILICTTCKLRKEKARLSNNYEAIITDKAQQQELTIRELKKYYSDEIDKLKAQGVKPNQIQHLVEIEYNVIDTTIYHDSLIKIYDTIRHDYVSYFSIQAQCNQIDGNIVNDTITITKIASNDSLLLALYQTKKCIVPKYRRYRAICLSACKGDTLSIINNIKIVK